MSSLHPDPMVSDTPDRDDVPAAAPAEGDLRERILMTALRLFGHRGFGSTSMRQVALEAGCTKPALYYHFGSKEDLFRAAVELCLRSLEPVLEEARAVSDDTRTRLHFFARTLLDDMQANPDRMRLLLSLQSASDKAHPDVDFHSRHTESLSHLAAVFAEGVERGDLRPDLDLEEAALILMGALHTHSYLQLKGIPSPPDVAATIVDLLFAGFAPSGPPTAPAPPSPSAPSAAAAGDNGDPS